MGTAKPQVSPLQATGFVEQLPATLKSNFSDLSSCLIEPRLGAEQGNQCSLGAVRAAKHPHDRRDMGLYRRFRNRQLPRYGFVRPPLAEQLKDMTRVR